MRRIQGKKHKIGTYEIDKISLSYFDYKRFVLNDGIHMLTFFDKDLKKNRFSQIIINKKRFKKIFIKRRYSHRQKGFKKSFYGKEETLTDKKDFHEKKRFSQIKRIPKDFHKKNKFSQMIMSKNKCEQINSR